MGGATERVTSDWVEPVPALDTVALTGENADFDVTVAWNGTPLEDGDAVPAGARLTASVTVRLRGDVPAADYLTWQLPGEIRTAETGWTALPEGGRWQISGRQCVVDLRNAPSPKDGSEFRFSFAFTPDDSGRLAFPGRDLSLKIIPCAATPLEYKGEDYSVRLIPSEAANLPEDAVLQVEERKDTDGYAARAMEKLDIPEEKVQFFRVFDLSIWADGKEIQPEGPVRVSIALEAEADEIVAMHFAEEPARRGAKGAAKAADGVSMLETEVAEGEVSFATDHFSVYAIMGYTLKKTITTGDGLTYEISMTFMEEAELPDDVDLSVMEITGDELAEYLGRTAVLMNTSGFAYGRVFDISLTDGEGAEVQPSAAVQVSVALLDAENTEDAFAVVHFGEDTAEQLDAATNGNLVTFSAEGFSAYAIVQGPEPFPVEWYQITSVAELLEHSESVYIGHVDGYYFKNSLVTDSKRSGIAKTTSAKAVPDVANGATPYTFVQADDTGTKFKIYCADDKYIRNPNNNSLTFSNQANATAFTLTDNGDGSFTLNNGQWYVNMQGGANGKRFCAYNTAGDVNNNLKLWYCVEPEGDPYKLDGVSYGLMNWIGGVTGRAMMAEENGGALAAKPLTVMTQKDDQDDKLFVPKESDITMWTFEWLGGDKYCLKTTVTVDGASVEKYLQVTGSGLALVTEPDAACELQVVPGSGAHAGQICLKSGSTTLTYSGTVENGFSVGGDVGSEWLYLVNPSELTSDYFRIYSAEKVSVADEAVTNGSRVILYCRVWNDTKKEYEFYAVDYNGKLVRCYESGDEIQWVGGQFNTMLWNFVEYYYEGTTTPNNYYELYNQYAERFLAPQVTDGQIVSPDTIGLNLNGRQSGAFYTTIVAWDDPGYAYACLKADTQNGEIVSIPYVKAHETPDAVDFGFAIVQDLPVDDELTTVPTVDHEQYGITMRIIDIATREEMSNFLGNNEGGAVTTLQQGLLSTDLKDDGFPTAKGGSLAQLYNGSTQVNHLFIQSTYSGSGYFEYDSAQNYAYLNGTDFIVYNEIATYDLDGRKTLKHGQFFPFNPIEAGLFASVNGKNLYDVLGRELNDNDPRKNERLYLIRNQDCYFAVDLEASFVQTADGLDAWGHDIIYQFTGDDDFWLYVDGELVIDLGGIHSAVPGSVNYRTGEVNVNGTHTTLRDLFYNNYKGRGHSDAEAQAYVNDIFIQNNQGQWIFKPDTTHTMRIFYMERGAGASNLHMRFNLASVKPGTVLLSKNLTGVDTTESVLAEFAYQIFYTLNDEDGELILQDEQSANVTYKDTTTAVDFRDTYTVGGITYNNVFVLKPGETAVIDFNDLIIAGSADDVKYRIVECGVNTDVYESVKANGTTLTGTPATLPDGSSVEGWEDYGIDYAFSTDRNAVTYENKVNPDALRPLTIKKRLYQEDGQTEITYDEDQTIFSMRLYLSTESADQLSGANMYTYHVKDPDGNYCRWDSANQRFVSLGKTQYSDLTEDEKTAASFSTSINGSISKIPATYEVEVRQLLAGTKYRVEERPYEIPDGYSFQRYDYTSGSIVTTSNGPGVQDTIVADQNVPDAHVDICNLKGFGLRLNKVWSDAAFMEEREPTYFAVFAEDGSGNLTLVDSPESSVRRLAYGEKTLYWYYLTLPISGVAFDHYRIREVTLSNDNPTIGSDGVVTDYGTVTPIRDYGEIQLSGRQKGETESGSFTYTVVYDEGTVSTDSNVRVDTVTNGRPGVALKKADWDWADLPGAAFVLGDQDGHEISDFVSDSDGMIALAFLRDNVVYTLTETGAPTGYYGMDGALTISLTDNGVVVGGTVAEDEYKLETGSDGIPTLTIRNRTASLQVLKVDEDTSKRLAGVHFALHKLTTVDGVTDFDINPMAGFEDIVTNRNGLLEGLTLETLSPGTYQLREKTVPEGYTALPEHLRFTIGANGTVTVLNAAYRSWLTKTVSDGHVDYVLEIRNDPIDPAIVTIGGIKVLNGRDMREGEFTFLLRPIDVNGQTIGRIAETFSQAAAEGEQSPFSFDPITIDYAAYRDALYHDANGNAWFYYEVREAVSDVADETGYDDTSKLRYDTGRYLVVIRVYEEDGALYAVKEVHEYDGGAVPAQYQPTSTGITT